MESLTEMQHQVRALASEKDTIILSHNYQLPEIQQVADIVGDSLVLASKAVDAGHRNILLCGVRFMAETAAILNPEKNVLMPDLDARCPMAEMVDAETVRILKDRYPGVPVVAYVNTTADIKAEADICCTSANSVDVVRSLPQKQVIMVPDCNLSLYTKRFFPEKDIIMPAGYCPTHQAGITPEAILEVKRKHPGAVVLVHPECIPEVIDMSDGAFSTEGMAKYVAGSDAREFIVGTEKEHAYRLSSMFPGKVFHPLPTAICPNMKKNTITKVLKSLESMQYSVTVPEDVAERARRALDAMLEVGRSRLEE